jgi:RNA-directed DNA polymerase
VTEQTAEATPATVWATTKQAGEIRARWAWVEPSVWTARMLTALAEGVKGGKWVSLMDKVYRLRTLEVAFAQVKANDGAAGVAHQSVAHFERDLRTNLHHLSEHLQAGTYRPQAVRRVGIPKPGSTEKRPLGVPRVRDRVVQAAVRLVVEPICARDFAAHSYGFRPARGCKDALRRVEALLKQGNTWIVDADLKSYFDTIPHAPLLERLREKIADGAVLSVGEAFLHQPVMDGLRSWTPEGGTPQGAGVSPLLANLYLDPLEHQMAQDGIAMVGYADDFVVLCRSRAEAEQALARVREWSASAGLTVHPDKTRIVDATQDSFDFLGYRFERGRKWPRQKSRKHFRDTIRAKTRRTNGQSLKVLLAEVNRTLKGWFEYFKHSDKTTFPSADGWVRGRLRSLLRKRQHRKGRARGDDHHRWPNCFFTGQGLFSLAAAHARACQSSRR